MLDLHNARVRADLGRVEHDIEDERRARQALPIEAQLRAADNAFGVVDLATRR